jgi:hypothetical protein
MMESYPMIGNWLCWKIGNGKNVRVGEDPWIGLGEGYKLSEALVEDCICKEFSHYGTHVYMTKMEWGEVNGKGWKF